MRWLPTTVIAVASLTGCSIGIRDGSPDTLSESVQVPLSLETAYRLADQHARQCHQSTSALPNASFVVDGQLFPESRTAVIHVKAASMGTDLERFEFRADGKHTIATVTLWGKGIWDAEELLASTSTLRAGVVQCK